MWYVFNALFYTNTVRLIDSTFDFVVLYVYNIDADNKAW